MTLLLTKMLCSVYSYWSSSRCLFSFASLYLIFIVYALCLWASLRLWVTNIEKLGNWTVTIQKFTFRLRLQSIILNFEQPNGYFLISFMTLTCCEKKLKRLEKCLGLGLSESRLGPRLGLKFKRLGLVSVSEKCGKVLGSVSSRTKKRMSRSRTWRSR